DWSRDGRFILYQENDPKTRADLWVLPMFGDQKAIPFLQTEFHEPQAQFSPDGQWIAYVSTESGNYEVYVQPFPGPGGKWQISTSGGLQPSWRADGKELFYAKPVELTGLNPVLKIMALEVRTDSFTFEAGIPEALFETRYGESALFDLRNHYAVTDDGERFLIVTRVEEAAASPITVVLNWSEELKRLVPAGE
ncbi:hypothetical protein MYX65_10915, partial [Acidobacteria bacterium AH-259-L09]|nr:hypothetical protein [Acidobacteria bacterium AH-259-L09]